MFVRSNSRLHWRTHRPMLRRNKKECLNVCLCCCTSSEPPSPLWNNRYRTIHRALWDLGYYAYTLVRKWACQGSAKHALKRHCRVPQIRLSVVHITGCRYNFAHGPFWRTIDLQHHIVNEKKKKMCTDLKKEQSRKSCKSWHAIEAH